MRYFLNDYIQTLHSEGARRATYALAEAKISKEQFGAIEQKLSKNFATSNVEMADIQTTTVVSGMSLGQKFGEIDLSISSIFRQSNTAALLLDSCLGVLSSDIKALEDELAVLEKSVDNYAFLLADNGAYDYAFLEGFSDERNREVGLPEITDRAGKTFRARDWAYIDPASGHLGINNYGVSAQKFPISSVTMVRNNVSSLLSNQDSEGLKHIINPRIDTGWRVSVKSPTLINGKLAGFSEIGTTVFTGLQMVLEFKLESPAPIDTIAIAPFADWGFTLSEVRTYKDDNDATAKVVYSVPKTLNQPFLVNFTSDVVSRFRLYIRQPAYRRTFSSPKASEDRNKKIFDELIQKNAMPNTTELKGPGALTGSRSSYGWWDQRMLMYLEQKRSRNNRPHSPFSISIPKADYRKNWGSFSYRSNTLERKSYEANRNAWNSEDWVTRLVSDVLRDISDSESIWGTVLNTKHQVKPAWSSTASNMRTDRDHNTPFYGQSGDPLRVQGGGDSIATMPYVYKMGIRNISVGSSDPKDSAVFLSKRLDAPGDIGTVRLKSDYTNIKLTDSSRDSERVTSVEFSVTNVSKPKREDDWKPILPIGTDSVVGERLYPDVAGIALLRFTAKLDATINIYINGVHKKSYQAKDVARRKDGNATAYDAVILPVRDFTSSDIITIDYTPSRDFTTIDFAPLDSTLSPPLISAYDSDGAGEGFLDSGNQLIVTTVHDPYIDYSQVETATYNTSYGLSGYGPIVVKFTDGTLAYNLTNYKGGAQSILDPGSDVVQFIQSKRSLMFNRVVTKPFRIFYQFQPSDVRVRVVLRCNYKDFASPRVDYYQIKGKTKKADAKRNM